MVIEKKNTLSEGQIVNCIIKDDKAKHSDPKFYFKLAVVTYAFDEFAIVRMQMSKTDTEYVSRTVLPEEVFESIRDDEDVAFKCVPLTIDHKPVFSQRSDGEFNMVVGEPYITVTASEYQGHLNYVDTVRRLSAFESEAHKQRVIAEHRTKLSDELQVELNELKDRVLTFNQLDYFQKLFRAIRGKLNV